MIPNIIVCTNRPFEQRSALRVMEASVEEYGQGAKLDVYYDPYLNFGQAYNRAVRHAFEDYPSHERFIIANEDIVLRPDTIDLLLQDAGYLSVKGINWGHIACRFDRGARTMQNILRNPFDHEPVIAYDNWIAPVCSLIQRSTWIDFPPINWGSDVIQCRDMTDAGFRVVVSRAYVHHVGGITCGDHALIDRDESRLWLQHNRPELAKFI